MSLLMNDRELADTGSSESDASSAAIHTMRFGMGCISGR